MRSGEERRLALRTSVRTWQGALRLYSRGRSHRAWLQLAVFAGRKMGRRPVPTTAFLALTYRCQLHCPHCYAAVEVRGGGDEMSTAEVKSVLDELQAIGVLQVVFTGGEPLLRGDAIELVAYAHRLGLITRLNSNGLLLTDDRVGELRRAGLDKCGVSIDSADPGVHDRLRGSPGVFERAVEALGRLRRAHIERQLLAYSSHTKLDLELERIIRLGTDIKVNSVFFTIPYLTGRWDDAFEEAFSDREMARLRGFLKHPRVVMEFPTAGTACDAYAHAIIHVNAQGGVTTCPAVPFLIGNVRRESLADIWRRLTADRPFEFRGRCPMNNRRDRERLAAHAAALARRP